MNVKREIPGKGVLDRIADENGVAISVVDGRGVQISGSNDNSICRKLNPDGEMTGACAAFCGVALEEISEAQTSVQYTCHAGLDCHADEMVRDGTQVAVIVGRAFIKSENYRKATERAISGDWQKFPPSEFFENVLLTGSSDVLERTLALVGEASTVVETVSTEAEEPEEVQTHEPETPLDAANDETPSENAAKPANKMAAEIARMAERINRKAAGVPLAPAEPVSPASDAGAWRSFFGSMLGRDHFSACNALLEFLAKTYGFRSLVWLERREDRLVTIASYPPNKKPRVRLGISINDPRLADAVRREVPIRLTERSKDGAEGTRKMNLFPVPVGGEVPSALAVLDPIEDELTDHQIARLCHSIAPQLEILRLRSEVARRDMLARAVRKFSDGLRHVDSDDFWMDVTLIAAELMQAERGSILALNDDEDALEIKAAVGIRGDISSEVDPGWRVAKMIFERGKPAVVAEVEKTGLPPFPSERGYKTSSFISAPVSIGGRNIAVINFTDKASGGAFDRTDLELLEEIAPQIAVAIDRAILKEKAGEFEQLSVTDALTGLLNRRYIEERLVEEVKRSNRHGFPMSYISIDVDHFKSYNDEFGHPAGDVALQIVAHILKETLRGADVAARVGGEEFAILLPQTTNDESAAIAERLRATVEAARFPCRSVTISVGVASCSSELCTTEGIVHASDKALYAAKHSGRNMVQIYEEIAEN